MGSPTTRPHATHISRKKGMYYYRRRIPCSTREVSLSLRTDDFWIAGRRSRALGSLFDFVVSSRPLMIPELQDILRRYLQRLIDEDLQRHLATPPGEPLYAGFVPASEEDAVDADMEVLSHIRSDLREALAHRKYERFGDEIDALMKENDLPASSRPALGMGVLQAQLQLVKLQEDRRMQPAPEIVLEPSFAVESISQQAAEPEGPLLQEVLPKFFKQMRQSEEWTEKTLTQSRQSCEMFVQLNGNLPVTAYTKKDHFTPFYDMLTALPSLWSKAREWRDMTPMEIVEQTAEDDEVPRLAMKTVKRHFSALGRLFTYLIKRGLYEGENPAHGFEFPSKGRPNSRRRMWEGDALAALFRSPVWTGMMSDSRRTEPGEVIVRDEKFWLPILALYHGNRLEEFAQLVAGDVREEDGIPYFDVNDDGDKQLKNEQSRRRIPMHPEVVRIGFLEYVKEVAPKPEDRVFPNLKPGGPDKRIGANFTKWWTRYRQQIGLYEDRLDFHSFRHGVTTKLFGAGVSQTIVDEITGHEGQGTSSKVYHKGSGLKALHAAIQKIEWPEVDFSHLYISSDGPPS